MTFDPVKQLENLLKRWTPDQRVDIQGVILDYVHRSGNSLFDVLALNHAIYNEVFIDGPQEAQLNLLRSVVRTATEKQQLESRCVSHFPAVAERLASAWSTAPFPAQTVSMQTPELVNWLGDAAHRRVVIWQLSDIHFGKFNVWLRDPTELAACLGTAAAMYREVSPDYIIVSGDLTSTAAEEELRDFCTFCIELSKHIWRVSSPQRIIVVPGNHDAAWLEDGTADRLARFSRIVGESGVCITPFGPESATFTSPNVNVSRFADGGTETPPYALVRLGDCSLTLLLLVTSYFSGSVPDDLRRLLTDEVRDTDLRERIIAHVRSDTGEMSMKYLASLGRGLGMADLQTVAVSHHHMEQYVSGVLLNKQAYMLRKLLSSKGIDLVFHGHLHMFEDREPVRGYVPGLAYCIPCTTLSSHTALRSRGFMIHVFGNAGDVLSLTWEVSAEGGFTKTMLRPAYICRKSETETAVYRVANN